MFLFRPLHLTGTLWKPRQDTPCTPAECLQDEILQLKDGVFSEYFHVNDADGNLALLPDNITPVDACMLSDMVPTGFHGVELADVQFGDTVLVIGIGRSPYGSCRSKFKRRIQDHCSRHTPGMCRSSQGYGAVDFISYKDGSIEDQVLAMTGGKGVDKVIVAGGGCETFESALKP